MAVEVRWAKALLTWVFPMEPEPMGVKPLDTLAGFSLSQVARGWRNLIRRN
jgi:hypothetical protein